MKSHIIYSLARSAGTELTHTRRRVIMHLLAHASSHVAAIPVRGGGVVCTGRRTSSTPRQHHNVRASHADEKKNHEKTSSSVSSSVSSSPSSSVVVSRRQSLGFTAAVAATAAGTALGSSEAAFAAYESQTQPSARNPTPNQSIRAHAQHVSTLPKSVEHKSNKSQSASFPNPSITGSGMRGRCITFHALHETKTKAPNASRDVRRRELLKNE